MLYSKDLFGSRLTITVQSKENLDGTINKCFGMSETFEKKYSRFIKGNYLYNLNKNKSSQIDGELLSIINLSQKVSKLTKGCFDITVLPFLENIGYGIEKEHQKEIYGYENIEIKGDNLILHEGVSIDIGAVGKGYIVDKIYNTLDTVCDNFIINFGGDIRVKGEHKIILEDPLDDKKAIGEIELFNLSIASSSPYKRKTKKGNHLINPKDCNGENKKIAIYITHKLSSFSDIFSTALFVTPLKKSINILNKIDGLEAMIITDKGEIYKTRGFNAKLYSSGNKK